MSGAVPGRAGDPRAPRPCPAFPAIAAGSAGSRGEGGCADGQGRFLFQRLVVSAGERERGDDVEGLRLLFFLGGRTQS